jgi:hypothetical protein
MVTSVTWITSSSVKKVTPEENLEMFATMLQLIYRSISPSEYSPLREGPAKDFKEIIRDGESIDTGFILYYMNNYELMTYVNVMTGRMSRTDRSFPVQQYYSDNYGSFTYKNYVEALYLSLISELFFRYQDIKIFTEESLNSLQSATISTALILHELDIIDSKKLGAIRSAPYKWVSNFAPDLRIRESLSNDAGRAF